MSRQKKSVKLLLAIVFGVVALSFVKAGMDNAVVHSEMPRNVFSCIPHSAPIMPSAMPNISQIAQTSFEPFAYLFQIMVVLFIISPPIIALMLFLIWRELRKRDKLK